MIPQQTLEQFPIFGDNATKVKPEDAKYSAGFAPADVLPAEWMNWTWNKESKAVTVLNSVVDSVQKELLAILSDYNINPNEATTNQVLAALKKIYPQVTTCASAASTAGKEISITGNVLKTGNVYVIEMTHGNTYGDGSATYPTLSVNGGTAYPMCNENGNFLSAGAWGDGDFVTVLFTGTKYLMRTLGVVDKIENNNMRPVTSDAVSVVQASTTTINGPKLGVGSHIKVMFTADISGADASTGMNLTWNGTGYAIKVGRNGSLVELKAHKVSSNPDVYKYVQAYTTLEMLFDGTQFIVMGNPVVLSASDTNASYTVYADGFIHQTYHISGDVTKTFLIPFSDANYTYTEGVGGSSTGELYSFYVQNWGTNKKATSIKLTSVGGSGTGTRHCTFVVEGY